MAGLQRLESEDRGRVEGREVLRDRGLQGALIRRESRPLFLGERHQLVDRDHEDREAFGQRDGEDPLVDRLVGHGPCRIEVHRPIHDLRDRLGVGAEAGNRGRQFDAVLQKDLEIRFADVGRELDRNAVGVRDGTKSVGSRHLLQLGKSRCQRLVSKHRFDVGSDRGPDLVEIGGGTGGIGVDDPGEIEVAVGSEGRGERDPGLDGDRVAAAEVTKGRQDRRHRRPIATVEVGVALGE